MQLLNFKEASPSPLPLPLLMQLTLALTPTQQQPSLQQQLLPLHLLDPMLPCTDGHT